MSIASTMVAPANTDVSNSLTRLSDSITHTNDSIGRAIVSCLNHFEAKANARGIRLEIHTDFKQLANINEHLDKLPLTSQFDPVYSEIGPHNGFWIKGIDSRGEIVHTQAVRFDDLTGTYLAAHLKSLKAFYENPEKSAHPEETCDAQAPATFSITGRVCYQGEMWLKKEGYRGRDLAMILPKISMALTLARWSPDYLYGTVQAGIVEKGVVAKYGHYNVQPHGIIYNCKRTNEFLDEWIEWVNWREIVDQIERSVLYQ
ncbi:MAG: hypothetical protein HON65_09180 [Rhodospirillales bacterium]|nr:hypothetical protein [Rhodospirillales bacterium]